jgi:hypothetical protein
VGYDACDGRKEGGLHECTLGMDEMDRSAEIRRIVKRHPIKAAVACGCILLFVALQIWDFHAPLAVSNWNKKEISRIKVADCDDFTFAVFGDNKEGYSLFDALLKDIAQKREISFVIAVGDLVPRGKRWLFRLFLREVQNNLAIPLIAALGNHDLHGRSADNFRDIFGPTYYSFQVGEGYFIILDATTGDGFNKTERHWLEKELKNAQTSTVRFVFMHVSPFDPRGKGFRKCLKDGKDLLRLFRRYNVTHLFASHIHGYFSGVWEGVPYTITGGAGSSLQGEDPDHFFHHYVTARVHQGKVETTVTRINAKEGKKPSFVFLKTYVFLETYVFEYGLLLVGTVSLLTLLISAKKGDGSRASCN